MRRFVTPSVVLVTLALVGTLVIFFTARLTLVQSLRIVFGSVLLFVVPGFIWSLVFFPFTKNEPSLEWTTRSILAVALSMAIVPLAIFFATKTGVRLTTNNTVIVTIAVIAVGLIILGVQRLVRPKQ